MPSSDDTILDLRLAEKQTVAELRAVAKKKGIFLTGITRKADIIAALAGEVKPKKKNTRKSGSAGTNIETLAKKINRDRAKLARDLEKTHSDSQEVRKALGAFVETPKKPKSPAKKKSPKKSSKSKKIYLLPYLNTGYVGKTLSTGNAKKDTLVKQRLLKDYTHVRDVFGEDLNTRGYHFDGKHIIIDIEDSRSKKAIEHEVKQIIEMGPDTWMEGDIVILDEDEAKGTKLKGLTELMFDFVKII